MVAASPLEVMSMSERSDPFHAFVDQDFVLPKGYSGGPLDGLHFSAKDVFDISGRTCGAGNPAWLKTHAPAARTAPIIDRLLAAGAALHGIVHTEELAFSLIGINAHYGAPINPNWPDYLTGGSSSGSAVAVASGVVDFALGTDTAGSIRVPASNCGLYSMRPSKQAGWTEGVLPLAPLFDVAGWMARDAQTLSRVSRVLIEDNSIPAPARILVDEAAFEKIPNDDRNMLRDALVPKIAERLKLPVFAADRSLSDKTNTLEAFRIVQAYEAWREHGDWVSAHSHLVSRGILERFEFGRSVTQRDYQRALATLTAWKTLSIEMLADAVLVQPTVTAPPLKRVSSEKAQAHYRQSCLQSTVTASVLGCPEIVLPTKRGQRPPIGLSLLAVPGADNILINLLSEL